MQAAVPGCFVKRWWGAWASKVSTGDFCARLSRAALFDPRDHAKKDPKKLCAFWGFISVPVVGVEPTRCHHQRILSPSRLPIPTHRLICCLYSILQAWQKIKIYFALIFTSQIRSKSTLDIPRIIGLSFFSAVLSLITPVFFQAIGAAKVSVAISVMREIICLIPIFWLLSRLGLGWTWWAFPLSETISGEFGLVLYLRQIHRWPDV